MEECVGEVRNGACHQQDADDTREHARPVCQEPQREQPQSEEDLRDEIAGMLQIQQQQHEPVGTLCTERSGVAGVFRDQN